MQFILNSADGRSGKLLFDIADPIRCADGAQCTVSMNNTVLFANIIGIDPMNAMENAIAAIRAYLAATALPYSWEDGSPYQDLSGN